jgi:DNA-binding response OmpR family regulator
VSKGINQVIKPVNPDLVLLDLVLLGPDGKPMGDGFQICREIKRVSKNTVPVVVISSKGDEESAEWAILQGADAFLQKPFAVEDLLAVLAQVLGS